MEADFDCVERVADCVKARRSAQFWSLCHGRSEAGDALTSQLCYAAEDTGDKALVVMAQGSEWFSLVLWLCNLDDAFGRRRWVVHCPAPVVMCRIGMESSRLIESEGKVGDGPVSPDRLRPMLSRESIRLRRHVAFSLVCKKMPLLTERCKSKFRLDRHR